MSNWGSIQLSIPFSPLEGAVEEESKTAIPQNQTAIL